VLKTATVRAYGLTVPAKALQELAGFILVIEVGGG
jgi:hypothetical protein